MKVGASEADIARCEAAIGIMLPDWLRERLRIENGWSMDDTAGITREEWRFLPVLDTSDRKRRKHTAWGIAHHTRAMRAEVDLPQGSVTVAHAYAEWTRLVLLPDPAAPDRLSPLLWRQNGAGEPVEPPIDPLQLGQLPRPVPGSRHRDRSELPQFRYHPDPVATGAIEANPAAVCPCCEKATGWEYGTVPYGIGDQPGHLCPWCIGDGSAAACFGSEFVGDIAGDGLPREVTDEVTLRTPGYVSWQGEQWQSCCGDAAVFLGPVGWERLREFPDAQASILDDGWAEETLQLMRADGDLTAYLFQCRHCGGHLAHADAS